MENLFSSSFRKHQNKQRKKSSYWLWKGKFSLLGQSLHVRQQLMLVLCFYRVIEAQFFYQSYRNVFE